MKHAIVVTNGPMITNEQDFITDMTPYMYEISESYKHWADVLEASIDAIRKGSVDVPPEVPDNEVGSYGYVRDTNAVATTGRPFIHKDLYHTCYPVIPGIDKKPDSGSDKKAKDGLIQMYDAHINMLWKTANHDIFLKMFSSMAEKGYIHSSYMLNLARLFRMFIEYNATFHGAISTIEFKTVLNKNQKKPILVLEVSSLADIPHKDQNTWTEWDNALRGTPISLSYKQMIPGMGSYKCTTDPLIANTDTNWIFQLSTNEMTGNNALVLLSCKEINTGNTYGLTIINKSFTLNTASNIKMQVVKDSEFRFTAAIDRAILHGISIQIRGASIKTIITNDPEWVSKLEEFGIVVENIDISGSGRAVYNFMIKSQTRDIVISLEAFETSQLDTFLPKLKSNTVALNHYTITIPGMRAVSVTSDIPDNKHVPVLDVPIILNLPVTTGIYDAKRIKAYALPILSYNNPSITDGVDATALDIGSIIPSTEAGYSSLMISVNRIPRKVINNEKVLLLRIVFETGSLYSTRLNEERGAEMFVNSELACQIEIDMNTGRVGSYYSGYTYGSTGTTTWHPSPMACIAANNLNIMYVPYAKWTILSVMDRSGSLTLKSDYKLEDIQTGIPDDSNYKSCELPEPIDENKYFGVVKIPYIIYNTWGLQVPTPTLIDFDRITVKSNTRQLFNINCHTCAYSDNTGTAIYIHPKLVYDISGYVLLPILFSNIDSVVITMCSGNKAPMDYTINVDLGELPEIVDPVEPEDPGQEPSEGDKNENGGETPDNPTTPDISDGTDETESTGTDDKTGENPSEENKDNPTE